MNFQQWLAKRGIDCQVLQPNLLAALQSQFESDCQRQVPVAEVLVMPSDCLWPARGYWVAAEVAL